MAMNTRDIPVTREQVQGWLNEPGMKTMPIRDFITQKVEALGLPDTDVDHPDLGITCLVEVIMEDLPSYGY